jgi:hypothetical protein
MLSFSTDIRPKFRCGDVACMRKRQVKLDDYAYGPDGKCLVPPDSVGLENQYCNLWRVFKDTIFVQRDYEVHIRTIYDRYIGEYVMHCRILDQDSGMMANILIVPDASTPGGGLTSRPREFHPRALPEPCMTLSSHTAPDVRPLPWHRGQ